jgi:hypothetical protein
MIIYLLARIVLVYLITYMDKFFDLPLNFLNYKNTIYFIKI